MTSKQPSFTDRLERAAGRKRLDRGSLEDLAGYAEEITGWANELDTKMADFAAEVELYFAGDTPREERAEIRERLLLRAEETAGALRALFQYGDPALA
jgi:hypothetical protein